VIDAGARMDAGVWGSGLTLNALAHQVAGVVIDGAVLGTAKLTGFGLPIFARGAVAASGSCERAGSINVAVRCGGVLVHPGDVVIGDADGVVAIASRRLAAAVEAEEQYAADVAGWREQLADSGSLIDVRGLQPLIDSLDIRWI
jgi:4-hydroxy-4-methyl-2-oxoglutarate aldolase